MNSLYHGGGEISSTHSTTPMAENLEPFHNHVFHNTKGKRMSYHTSHNLTWQSDTPTEDEVLAELEQMMYPDAPACTETR